MIIYNLNFKVSLLGHDEFDHLIVVRLQCDIFSHARKRLVQDGEEHVQQDVVHLRWKRDKRKNIKVHGALLSFYEI